jgi:hypothetical protein
VGNGIKINKSDLNFPRAWGASQASEALIDLFVEAQRAATTNTSIYENEMQIAVRAAQLVEEKQLFLLSQLSCRAA